MKKWLLLCCGLLCAALHVQAQDEPYAAEWRLADSLLQTGLPQSAQQVAQRVYGKARAAGQEAQAMKAQIYLMNALAQNGEGADSVQIAIAEQEARSAAFPFNAIWYSIAAQLYWQYYEQHRWQILQRTRLAASGDDMAFWDAAKFYDKVSGLYLQSLANSDALQQVAIARIRPVVVKGVHTEGLRPTLYDLLVFRAAGHFENEEKDIIRPAYRFVIGDTAAFAPAAVFVQHRFVTADTVALHFRALSLYRQVLAFHSRDKDPSAFIDADLHRLDFVYRHAVLPDKGRHYREALERIAAAFPTHPLTAAALFRVAELTAGQAYEQQPGNKQAAAGDLPEARAMLERIIARFPGSEGASLAQGRLQGLTQQELQLQAEEVVLPEEASRVLVTYRNAPAAYFRVIRVQPEQYRSRRRLSMQDSSFMQLLLKQSPVYSWQERLPGTEDLRQHSAEVKADPLPEGAYVLIAGADTLFRAGTGSTAVVWFQVSRISMLTMSPAYKDGTTGFILDRKTGRPLADARITFLTQDYNSKTRAYDYRRTGTAASAADGSFRVSGNNISGMTVQHGGSVLFQDGYFPAGVRREAGQAQERTLFFTDRSMYRPGQTIYFKGIIIRTDSNGRSNSVIAGRETKVTFFDVNGQQIGTQTLTSNAYGSVHGAFTAPESGLTGLMRIGNGSGDCYVSVEAYKRPKFRVQLDTLKAAAVLNERVTVSGTAQAYAGYPLDGAAVSYRVVRAARFPYEWLFYYRGIPRTEEAEIANGTTQTDTRGAFSIAFTALPDRSADSSLQPVFTYTVYADVTDLNGETHSGQQSFSIGYQSLRIVTALPSQAQPAELDSLYITTSTLNGDFIPANVQLSISLLRTPGVLYRQRLWQRPDKHIMDEAAFRTFFPLDEYAVEHDPAGWEQERTVYERTLQTQQNGRVHLPAATWKTNGWYVIEITAKDHAGKTVREKKFIQVFDPSRKSGGQYGILAIKSKDSYAPGDKAQAWLAPGMENTYWLQQEQSSGTTAIRAQDVSGRQPVMWERTVREQDRGGINVSWITVKENRVYEAGIRMPVPWTNKDLHIRWETHRDKLEPGAKETWTMTVSGNGKEAVAAEIAATLYDASLDAFRPHSWQAGSLYPDNYGKISWVKHSFGISYGNTLWEQITDPGEPYRKQYDELLPVYAPGRYWQRMAYAAVPGMPVAKENREMKAREDVAKADIAATGALQEEAGAVQHPQSPEVRSNLAETAFFYPALQTDSSGSVCISFTMPEALTEWKLLAFAHTGDMRYGLLEGPVRTQKELMVTPGLPRFLRQGDRLVISAKISNLSPQALTGTVSLELLDATTLKPVHLAFRLQQAQIPFRAGAQASTSVSWAVQVPESLYEPVLIRITAGAGNFTDGETQVLPVVSNRMLVTETLPLQVSGYGSRSFRFDKLLAAGGSSTLAQHRLTVEFTGNPAWYVVQALPYLAAYPYECAEQVFNRYYAGCLAAHIAGSTPRIREVFRTWQSKDTAALLSALEKNRELKTALLEETPWVLEAQDETEQQRRIALLFEAHTLNRNMDAALAKLQDMLLPEGAFPWFKGNPTPDRYITQYITTGIGRLQHLGIKTPRAAAITTQTISWLDRRLLEDYKRIPGTKTAEAQQITPLQAQYLYMRSLFPAQVPDKDVAAAIAYYKKQAAKYWPSCNAYVKGMIALALHRGGDRQTAQAILRSLRETAIRNEGTGIYWLQPGRSWWWHEAPVEAQALLVECFQEITQDTAFIDGMRLWLLQQKRTQHWSTTKATADACYAFLLQGTQWLAAVPEVTIQLGKETIRSREQEQQASTGYFKTAFTREQITPELGEVTVTVSPRTSGGTGAAQPATYGAVYWQYFEHMDKITAAASPLAVRRQLLLERNTDRGPELVPITDGQQLSAGDKVKARIEITADRDMEYIHLKDMRGAGFEPAQTMSGYRWQGGLGYYESTGDISYSCFIQYLGKGKYVFEYPMFVTQAGTFSSGIATIQCMYAPEFAGHSEEIRVTVK